MKIALDILEEETKLAKRIKSGGRYALDVSNTVSGSVLTAGSK